MHVILSVQKVAVLSPDVSFHFTSGTEIRMRLRCLCVVTWKKKIGDREASAPSNVSRGKRHLGKHVFRIFVPALEYVILLSHRAGNGAVSSGL